MKAKHVKIGALVLAAIAISLMAFTSLFSAFADQDVVVHSVTLESKSVSYEAGDGGAWSIDKHAEWTGSGKARVTFDVDTLMKSSEGDADILFVVDISGSMSGNKIIQVQHDMDELTRSLLNGGNNRIGIVSFDSRAKVVSGFTDNLRTLLSHIDSLIVNGSTNYYDALLKADEVLDGYEMHEGRDLILLFLTDGYPNVDVPNEIAQYEYLKAKYPGITINAVQYEMGTDILNPIKVISDSQFIADMNTLNNVLFEASIAPYIYDKFEITDLIDDDYWTIDGVESINASVGTVELVWEGSTPKVIWNFDGELRSGDSAKLTIDLKLKGDKIDINGLYPTNKGETVSTKLEDTPDENIVSEETPVLRGSYDVYYEGNEPNDCTVVGLPEKESHTPFETVAISDEAITCSGYNFAGYEIVEGAAKRLNDDYFIMPGEDVILRATWTKFAIEKTTEGTVYTAKKLYEEIARKTNGTDEDIDFTKNDAADYGVNTVASTIEDEYPVHYFRGDVVDNNILFADICWLATRTTSTGGVKLLYNGLPTEEGKCNGSTAGIGTTNLYGGPNGASSWTAAGYMYGNSGYTYTQKALPTTTTLFFSAAFDENYWFADSYSCRSSTNCSLVDPVPFSEIGNYDDLIGKYTVGSTEPDTTSYRVNQIIDIVDDKYYYITVSSSEADRRQDRYMVGDSYTEKDDGTYTIDGATAMNLREFRAWWSENYADAKAKYICRFSLDGNCNIIYFTTKTTETNYSAISSSMTYKFSSDFSYVDGQYVLDDDAAVTLWDIENPADRDKVDYAHYTCFNTSGTCTNLSYVYYYGIQTTAGANNNPSYWYISLKNGEGVEEAIEKTLQNTTDSAVKKMIDNWYYDNLSGSEYEEIIEDTIYCNDRSFADNNGWIPDGGDIDTLLHFGAYGRILKDHKPSIDCQNKRDAFTVNEETGGNGMLEFPVGMLTADEYYMAGLGAANSYNGNYIGNTSTWSMSPALYTMVWQYHFSSSLSSNGNSVTIDKLAVRPSISLQPGLYISNGNGTAGNPWVIEP